MKELDKLVENYFAEKKAPELGMDMLLEMVEQSLEEISKQKFEGYSEQEATDIINFLQSNERYPEAEKHVKSSSSITLAITNMGGAMNRHNAFNFLEGFLDQKGLLLKKTKPYGRDSRYFIGATIFNKPVGDEEPSPKFKLEFRAGRNPFSKENLAFENLKAVLTDISKELGDSPLTIFFGDGENRTPDYVIDPPVADDIGKVGKSDFSIGNKIFISHKDAHEDGAEPKDFGQYSGLSTRANLVYYDPDAKKPEDKLKQYPEIDEFNKIVNKVFKELKIESYPSSIDFQKDIKAPELSLKSVFGRRYGTAKSGKDNADFVIQGDISLTPEMGEDDEPTGKYRIGGERIFSREEATRNKDNLKDYFPDGYLPVFSVRKGDSGRKSFGILGARATIYTKAGRYPNFIFTIDSTPEKPSEDPEKNIPEKIEFVKHELDKRQLKNVYNFEQDLNKKGTTRENNPMLRKMLSSITNYEQYLEDLEKKKKNNKKKNP